MWEVILSKVVNVKVNEEIPLVKAFQAHKLRFIRKKRNSKKFSRNSKKFSKNFF